MWVTQTTQTWVTNCKHGKKCMKLEVWRGGFRGAIARKFGSLKKFRSFKQGRNQYCESHTTWIGKGKKSL